MIINPKNFIQEIPLIHPLSREYIDFWREEKRKCIEGTWVGGYYMPPALYFYTNYATIKLNKSRFDSRKVYSRPYLRDLEWDLFQAWTACQGFSGFMDDPEYTSLIYIDDPSEDLEALRVSLPYVFKEDGTPKRYIPALDYLKLRHDKHYKYPLYQNPSYNLLIAGSRDSGKSYAVGCGFVLHQWLFDGALKYDRNTLEDPKQVDITVGAEGAEKSKLIMDKIKVSLEMLPGSQEINGKHYKSPFSKQYTGSWALGKEIKAEYQKKVGGDWKPHGSRSMLKHRSFRDNPFADQGSRPTTIVLEEAGLFSNLKEVYHNTKDNLADGLKKIGSLVMMGTGGDMDKGTIDMADMFYNPAAYSILPFEDKWENKGKIGYFIHTAMVLNEYLDDDGHTRWDIALKHIQKQREEAKKKSSYELNKIMQYRPIKPSEMFLAKTANIFPSPELRRRLSEITTDKFYESSRLVVDLMFDPNSYNGVKYEVNHSLEPIDTYPTKDNADREGAVVLYEVPNYVDGRVPEGAYIIGCDPFKDDSSTGGSLASIYVVKTNKYPHMGYSQIVASYVGRPYTGKAAVNEILLKLSLLYGNAKIYFENNVGNVKDYFEKIRRLDLLALQPTTVFNKKAAYNTTTPNIYGYAISNDKVKWEALQYLRMWLLEDRESTEDNVTRNLDLIPDPGLLQELMNFTLEGNFDRVMSCVGFVLGLEELYNTSKRRQDYESSISEMDKEFEKVFTNNKKIFNVGFTKTETLF
jgi:hypothetical protein